MADAADEVPDLESARGPRMGIPEAKGEFKKLPKSHYRVTIRKGQGWQTDQIAKDLKLSKRTVSSYLERAKDKMGAETVQQLMFMVYQTYAPDLCPPYWGPEPEGDGDNPSSDPEETS